MTPTELKERKARFQKISKILTRLFPDAKIALTFKNNWELMVAVRLSAQCTDKKVNEITPALFKKYPTMDAYAKAKPAEFQKDIYQTGFFRSKTKDIIAAANYLQKIHKGKVPRTMAEMIKVPGVGRKSANVILGNAYGVVEGIAVDTHVMRLAHALGLSKEKTPEKIEKDLMEIVPKKDWFVTTYRIINYGRMYCPARPHDHSKCPLKNYTVSE